MFLCVEREGVHCVSVYKKRQCDLCPYMQRVKVCTVFLCVEIEGVYCIPGYRE